MATPTVLDTLPTTRHTSGSNFTYTVPSGTNLCAVVLYANGDNTTPTFTLNGQSFTVAAAPNRQNNLTFAFYGYLVAPTTGTFVATGNAGVDDFIVVTFDNVDQVSPIDIANASGGTVTTTNTLTLNTNVGNDAIIEYTFTQNLGTLTVDATETIVLAANSGGQGKNIASWKPAGSVSAAETMISNTTVSLSFDHWGLGIKFSAGGVVATQNNRGLGLLGVGQ